jgi:hypothetical protein
LRFCAKSRENPKFSLRSAEAISYNLAASHDPRAKDAARGAGERSTILTLTCPSCGNSQNFLVKTLQMHVVHLEDSRVEVSEESRPAVFEVLCDECETALNFEEFEDALRKEVLLTLGAR